MPNNFLTTKTIAREALMRLRNQLVMRPLVYNDYSNEFRKQGDTIRIKKPAVYEAKKFTSQIDIQDIKEDRIEVKLDTIADVSINISSKERSMNLENFSEQVLAPAMEAIAQQVDEDLHKLSSDIPYWVGQAGVTPDGLDDFANARKKLNQNKVPFGNRNAVWNPEADAKFIQLASLVNAEKSGSTAALREGAIGRVAGMNNYMSQNVLTHTAGSYVSAAGTKVKVQPAVGDTTIQIKSTDGGTGTLKKGDLFSIGADQYVVTADAMASANDITVSIYPSVKSAYAVDTDVVFADKTALAHVSNLAFHKKAFALVVRPLEPPRGGADSYTTSFEGLSLRVTSSYDINKKLEIVSIDILYGTKTLYPELATQILG